MSTGGHCCWAKLVGSEDIAGTPHRSHLWFSEHITNRWHPILQMCKNSPWPWLLSWNPSNPLEDSCSLGDEARAEWWHLVFFFWFMKWDQPLYLRSIHKNASQPAFISAMANRWASHLQACLPVLPAHRLAHFITSAAPQASQSDASCTSHMKVSTACVAASNTASPHWDLYVASCCTQFFSNSPWIRKS